ncbi:hypothetical protein CY34DRAFT_47488, partial [Suillus luteus UH-Slu-Lm8-n1]
VSDLYSAAENDKGKQQCAPFLHYTSFLGLHGEIVRVKALFNEGAMTSVMCASVFDNVKHRLGNWHPSSKHLRMADGAVVQSEAVWKGEVSIGGIQAQGEFEVLCSRGGWKFLFGKPLLQAFKAIHDYEVDEVQV